MLNQKNQRNDSSTFWSGFSLGLLSGSILLYAFGTKKGRQTLKKALDNSETIEDNISQIIKLIQENITSEKQAEKKK
jgi:hypothetical protein